MHIFMYTYTYCIPVNHEATSIQMPGAIPLLLRRATCRCSPASSSSCNEYQGCVFEYALVLYIYIYVHKHIYVYTYNHIIPHAHPAGAVWMC